MSDQLDFVVSEFTLPADSFLLLRDYSRGERMQCSIRKITHRYARIVEDSRRVAGKFSIEHIKYIKENLRSEDTYPDSNDRLLEKALMWIYTDQQMEEEDFKILPPRSEEMIAQIKSLTIGEEFALIEFIEKLLKFDEVDASWPKGHSM